MRRRTPVRRILPTLPALAALSIALLAVLPLGAAGETAALADELLTVKGHAEGVRVGDRVQPPRDTDVKVWLAADKLRRDEGGTTFLVRLDRHKLYIVNHAERSYTAVDLPIEWMKLVPPRDQESFSRFMADSQITSKVTPTPDTKVFHGWNCHRIQIELTNNQGLKVIAQWWLTKDLPLAAAYNQLSASLASLQISTVEWSRKMAQLDGFPVYQDTTVTMGGATIKTQEEVTSVDTREAPPGTYDVPAGFTLTPFDPFHPQH
jgi:hypothetical protein